MDTAGRIRKWKSLHGNAYQSIRKLTIIQREADCEGQQSVEFGEDGEWTYNLFGKPRHGPNKPHFSFKCTCLDKCTVPSNIAKPPARRAALGAGTS